MRSIDQCDDSSRCLGCTSMVFATGKDGQSSVDFNIILSYPYLAYESVQFYIVSKCFHISMHIPARISGYSLRCNQEYADLGCWSDFSDDIGKRD
jgi:hypothetical protein